jgi:hypothetical protein
VARHGLSVAGRHLEILEERADRVPLVKDLDEAHVFLVVRSGGRTGPDCAVRPAALSWW